MDFTEQPPQTRSLETPAWHIEKRTEFEDPYDAGEYMESLAEAAHSRLQEQVKRIGVTDELAIEKYIISDMTSGGPLPKVAERGIRSAGLPRSLFLLEYVPLSVRRQTTALHREGISWVLMPKIDKIVMRDLLNSGQVIAIQSAADSRDGNRSKLINHESQWQEIAGRLHEATFYPGSTRPSHPVFHRHGPDVSA